MQTSVTLSHLPQPLATLRMADLAIKFSAGRGTIYDLIKDPDRGFPVAFSYGGRGVYYFTHKVDAWLLQQQTKILYDLYHRRNRLTARTLFCMSFCIYFYLEIY